MIDNSSNISVIALKCLLTESPFNLSEYGLLKANLFSFEICLPVYFHSLAGLSEFPIKYKSDGLTDSTIIAKAWSFYERYFEYKFAFFFWFSNNLCLINYIP